MECQNVLRYFRLSDQFSLNPQISLVQSVPVLQLHGNHGELHIFHYVSSVFIIFHHVSSGCWLTYPSEKYESQLGS